LIVIALPPAGYKNVFEIGGNRNRFENSLNSCKPLLFLDLQFLRNSFGEIVSYGNNRQFSLKIPGCETDNAGQTPGSLSCWALVFMMQRA
jgi:hypothetical protein